MKEDNTSLKDTKGDNLRETNICAGWGVSFVIWLTVLVSFMLTSVFLSTQETKIVRQYTSVRKLNGCHSNFEVKCSIF